MNQTALGPFSHSHKSPSQAGKLSEVAETVQFGQDCADERYRRLSHRSADSTPPSWQRSQDRDFRSDHSPFSDFVQMCMTYHFHQNNMCLLWTLELKPAPGYEKDRIHHHLQKLVQAANTDGRQKGSIYHLAQDWSAACAAYGHWSWSVCCPESLIRF